MATVTPSLKVNQAISNVLSATSSGTLYTAAANSYGMVQVGIGSITTPAPGAAFPFNILVNGRIVFQVFFVTTTTYIISTVGGAPQTYTGASAFTTSPIYVGPGHAVTVATGGGGAATWYISGVELINS
jgi:hypothetical protein